MLIGDNGSGKSTLGKLVSGLEKPTQGEVSINGEQVFKLTPKTRVRSSYYISQINALQFVKSTLQGEIKLAEKIANKQYNDDLIASFHLPDDLEYNPFELTVNQAWRFALFISTIIDPTVLFIDEIPSSTNKINLKCLQEYLSLRKASQKITFLSYQRGISLRFDKEFIITGNSISMADKAL